MDFLNQKEDSCVNCEHYIQHYALHSNYCVSAIFSGHCRKKCKKCKPDYVCEMFKKDENKKRKEKQITALNILSKIYTEACNFNNLLNKN